MYFTYIYIIHNILHIQFLYFMFSFFFFSVVYIIQGQGFLFFSIQTRYVMANITASWNMDVKKSDFTGEVWKPRIIKRGHTIPIVSSCMPQRGIQDTSGHIIGLKSIGWILAPCHVFSFLVRIVFCMSISQQSGLWHQEAWVEAIVCLIALSVCAWRFCEKRL